MNPDAFRNGEPGRQEVPYRSAPSGTVGNLRLRGGTDAGFANEGRPVEPVTGEIGPRELAVAIASYTVEALVEASVLDPVSEFEPYQVYCRDLGHEPSAGHDVLRFLFP